MTGRRTITAAAAVLLLFALIWLIAPIHRLHREEALSDPLLPGFPAEPESLFLANDSVEAVLVPRDDSWMIVRPVKDVADSAEIRRILTLLRGAPALRIVDPAPDSAGRFGLDPPRAVVRAGGRILAVGDPNPTRDGVYAARPPGPEVLLTVNAFAGFPGIRLADLRDRRPLRFPYRRVESVAFTRRGRTVTLRRTGRNSWTAEEAGVRGNAVAAWRILAHLMEGRVHGWTGGEAYRAGDDPFTFRVGWPSGEASLTIGAGVPETALRVARAPDRSDAILLPRRVIDSLETWSRVLLDPFLLGGNPAAEESVFIEGEGEPFTLARAGEGWTVRSGAGGEEADPSRTRAYLTALGRLRAARFLDPADAAGEGTTVLRIRTGSGEAAVERRPGGVLVGRRAGEKGALILEPAAEGVTGVSAEDFRSRRLFPAEIRAARRVRIEFPGFTVEASREGVEWTLREPIPGPGRNASFEDLLDRLASLRWVRREREEGLAETLVRIEAEGEWGVRTLRLGGSPALVLAETEEPAGLLEIAADAAVWVPARLDHWRNPSPGAAER